MYQPSVCRFLPARQTSVWKFRVPMVVEISRRDVAIDDRVYKGVQYSRFILEHLFDFGGRNRTALLFFVGYVFLIGIPLTS